MKKITTIAILGFIASITVHAMGTPPIAVSADPAGGLVPASEYTRLLVLQSKVGKRLQVLKGTSDPAITAKFNELQRQMGTAQMAQRAPNRARFNEAATRVRVLVPEICDGLGGC